MHLLLKAIFLPSLLRRPHRHRASEAGFKHQLRSAEHGFTLTELMVVIVIIGLLSVIVLVNVTPSVDTARITRARADIASIETAMELYRMDNFSYPSAADGLGALRTAPASMSDASRYRSGGYLSRLPNDPWDRPYQLQVPGRNGAPFAILSLGADGSPGGQGNDADIIGSDES